MKTSARSDLWQFALALAAGSIAGAAPETTAPDRASTSPVLVGPASIPTPPVAPPPPTAVVPKPRPRLSTQLTSQLSSQLPVWRPPPPGKEAPATPPPADPNVVQMKPVVVLGDKLPRVDEKEWLTPKARDAVLMKEYLSSFDRSFLNRYTLPLVGMSKEARAAMMYAEDKRLQDLGWMNDQVDQLKKVDPAEAKELAKIRDTTFTRGNP